MRGYGYNMMGMGWGWLIGAVLLVLILAVAIVVLRMATGHQRSLVRSSSSKVTPTRGDPQTPRQILDDRYARGDITTEEFDERLQNPSRE
jgi:putative membrane protein